MDRGLVAMAVTSVGGPLGAIVTQKKLYIKIVTRT